MLMTPAARRRSRATAARSAERRRQAALLVLLALVPLAFVTGTVGGFQLTGWAWLLGAAVVTPLALVEPVRGATLRLLTPYLAFLTLAALSLAWAPAVGRGAATLAQLLVPVPAYLLAARIQDRASFVRRAAGVATTGIAVACALTALALAGVAPAALELSPRPMAVALIVLFAVASLRASPTRAAALAGATLAVSVATGGRTSSFVLLVMIVLSPAWHLRWRGRAALALAGLIAVVALSTTQAFQERFFFGSEGTLSEVVTGGSALNTAGRRELWPRLVEECSRTSVFGAGIGTGSRLSSSLTDGALAQPHNDYLRTYCDVGLAGAIPFWAFFTISGISAFAAARRGSRAGAAAVQGVVALLLLSVTDNPLVYTAHFMLPVALLLGLARSERADEP